MINVDPEAPDLKAEWIRSGDVQFAAIAIGRWPSDPPIWSVLACCAENARYQRSTTQGYSKDKDGQVLDEVIRIYFKYEDEAKTNNPEWKPSDYIPPELRSVIARSLLNVEGIEQATDVQGCFRSRLVAIERRIMEEEEGEGFPERMVDGARETKRYIRIRHEWGLNEIGGYSHLHSMALYLNKIIDGEA